jgi:hypothetical protein
MRILVRQERACAHSASIGLLNVVPIFGKCEQLVANQMEALPAHTQDCLDNVWRVWKIVRGLENRARDRDNGGMSVLDAAVRLGVFGKTILFRIQFGAKSK